MDIEDYVDILRRHKGWIVGPAFAGLVIAVVVAFLWPDTYVSDAMIRIVPPSVPEKYVASNVNLQVGQRIAGMSQQVLSRSNLLALINENSLYPRKKNRVPDADIVEEMQRDIEFTPVSALREPGAVSTAFRVSFSYENRYTAQKVVSKIVSDLVNATMTMRSNESNMTTDFLKDKVGAAKTNLDKIENQLTEYRLRFSGKLPEQLQSNMQQLNVLSTQLSAMSSSINRATQEKLQYESQLRSAKEQFEAIPTTPGSAMEAAAKNERLSLMERQILDMEAQLSGLREQYKDTHPDVRRVTAQLDTLKKTRDSLLKAEEKKVAVVSQKKEPAAPTREQAQGAAIVDRLQSLIQAKDMEIEQLVKEQARIDKSIRLYQDRIDASPFGEREYARLTRDYGMAKQQYEELTLKTTQSSMATDLESRKQGELLEVLEQASLPQTPAKPNRWYWVSAGTFMGLLLGVFLTGGKEMRDTSLKNLKDIRAYTGLPVLGSVPLVQSDFVEQRKRRLLWLAWSTTCIVGFVLMLGSVYYYYTRGS
jgi:polysaccharide chain length determinant protein (PEP-CTERM system associated)